MITEQKARQTEMSAEVFAERQEERLRIESAAMRWKISFAYRLLGSLIYRASREGFAMAEAASAGRLKQLRERLTS
jgi:hypothetical protein